MKSVKTSSQLKAVLHSSRKNNKTLGFVPTMGALHEGHLSLIRRARKQNDVVAVSIFVNPLQFDSKSDLRKYPRNTKRDLKLCRAEGVDVVYLPNKAGFYSKPFLTSVKVSELTKGLCGRTRPGHFEGVATVVLKLFNQVRPDRVYFGKKDFQQLRLMEQLVKDLDLDIRVVACPIVREPDGLAMSSRNERLSPGERQRALVLNESLKCVKLLIYGDERRPQKIVQKLRSLLNKRVNKIDYVEVADAHTLKPLKRIQGRVLIAIAAFVGNVRLIDNIEITVKN